jgi:hypothetical protein
MFTEESPEIVDSRRRMDDRAVEAAGPFGRGENIP